MNCYGGQFCTCPKGPFFPPEEVEAARQRVVIKRAIRRALRRALEKGDNHG